MIADHRPHVRGARFARKIREVVCISRPTDELFGQPPLRSDRSGTVGAHLEHRRAVGAELVDRRGNQLWEHVVPRLGLGGETTESPDECGRDVHPRTNLTRVHDVATEALHT